MATKKWKGIRRPRANPADEAADKEWIARTALELSLRELRELADKTQTEIATSLEATQSELSRLERREDHLLSTLRRYVEAIGGKLEVVAVLGNKRVTLKGV